MAESRDMVDSMEWLCLDDSPKPTCKTQKDVPRQPRAITVKEGKGAECLIGVTKRQTDSHKKWIPDRSMQSLGDLVEWLRIDDKRKPAGKTQDVPKKLHADMDIVEGQRVECPMEVSKQVDSQRSVGQQTDGQNKWIPDRSMQSLGDLVEWLRIDDKRKPAGKTQDVPKKLHADMDIVEGQRVECPMEVSKQVDSQRSVGQQTDGQNKWNKTIQSMERLVEWLCIDDKPKRANVPKQPRAITVGDGKAACLMDLDGQHSVKQKKPKQAFTDVRARAKKLEKKLDILVKRTDDLLDMKARMDYAMRNTGCYIDVAQQCLVIRGNMNQVRDNIKRELLNEVSQMKNEQKLLRLTSNVAQEQLRKNHGVMHELEKDLKNQFQSSCQATENYFENLGKTLPGQHGVMFGTNSTSPDWWQISTQNMMYKREIQLTESLIIHMDNILGRISYTQRRQINITNQTFNVSLKDSKVKLQRLFSRTANRLRAYSSHVRDARVGCELMALSADINVKIRDLCTHDAKCKALHDTIVVQKY